MKADNGEYMVSGTDGVKVLAENTNKKLQKDIENQLQFDTLVKSPDPTYIDSKGEKIDFKKDLFRHLYYKLE